MLAATKGKVSTLATPGRSIDCTELRSHLRSSMKALPLDQASLPAWRTSAEAGVMFRSFERWKTSRIRRSYMCNLDLGGPDTKV